MSLEQLKQEVSALVTKTYPQPIANAFGNMGLTSVIIPGTVTFIGNFSNNELTRIVIPAGVTHIKVQP